VKGEVASWVSVSGVNNPPPGGLDRCGEESKRNEISSSMAGNSSGAAKLESTPFISSITLWKFRTADGERSESGGGAGKTVVRAPFVVSWRRGTAENEAVRMSFVPGMENK